MRKINEIFYSLQGEGHHEGYPSVFIRFSGCNLSCPFCDTKHDKGIFMDDDAIIHAVKLYKADWIVLTGGEPCRHDLTELTSRLVAEGFRVQIETSGTMPIRCHADVWVTLSPKLDMPGGLAVRQDAWERAGEIKFPVDTAADLARFEQALAAARKAAVRPLTELVWLQPVSQGKEATRLCVEAAFAHQWRVSVQVHKYLDLR